MATPWSMLERAALNVLRGSGRRVVLEVAREVARRARAAPAARPPEPPATRRDRVVEAALLYGWVASLAALGLIILNADLLLPRGAARAVARLATGALLLSEGTLLASDAQRSRQRLRRRLRRRHPAARWSSRPADLGLTLAGVVLLSAGLFDVLRGALEL